MPRSDTQQVLDSMAGVGLDAMRAYVDAVETFMDVVGKAGGANPFLTAVNSLPKANPFLAANPFAAAGPTGCCDVPPACWLPRSFGDFQSRACACGTALLRIQVTNCQPRKSTVAIQLSGAEDLKTKVMPESATLEPLQRKWFTVAVSIPDEACKGQSYDLVVRVTGCSEYYARWTVVVASGASGTCLEAAIDDCPDYVHHWYDHFYCQRPCFARADGRTG